MGRKTHKEKQEALAIETYKSISVDPNASAKQRAHAADKLMAILEVKQQVRELKTEIKTLRQQLTETETARITVETTLADTQMRLENLTGELIAMRQKLRDEQTQRGVAETAAAGTGKQIAEVEAKSRETIAEKRRELSEAHEKISDYERTISRVQAWFSRFGTTLSRTAWVDGHDYCEEFRRTGIMLPQVSEHADKPAPKPAPVPPKQSLAEKYGISENKVTRVDTPLDTSRSNDPIARQRREPAWCRVCEFTPCICK